ncbi:MAG: hypothetical protein WBN56_06035 [Robiginitalea sp.]
MSGINTSGGLVFGIILSMFLLGPAAVPAQMTYRGMDTVPSILKRSPFR